MYNIPLEYCGTFYAALDGILLAGRPVGNRCFAIGIDRRSSVKWDRKSS